MNLTPAQHWFGIVRECLREANGDWELGLAAAECIVELSTSPSSIPLAHDIHNPRAQGVFNRAMEAARSLVRSARSDLEVSLKEDGGQGVLEFVDKYRLALAELLQITNLAAVLEGAQEVAAKVPQIDEDAQELGQIPTPAFSLSSGIALSVLTTITDWIRGAANLLASKGVITRHGYDAMDAAARAKSFTVAGVDAQTTLEKIRDILAKNVREGADYKAFRKEVLDAVDEGTFLSEAHLETLFRTNVQTAFSDGQMHVLQHPLIRSRFPYSAYDAIHDDRVRDNHLALEKLGIGGTNIYRNDDPVFQTFRPPWDYNDRCSWTVLTVQQAAERGISEAQEWARTGVEPFPPAYVPMPPFSPPSGFQRSLSGAPLSIQLSLQSLTTFSLKEDKKPEEETDTALLYGVSEGGGPITTTATDTATDKPSRKSRIKVKRAKTARGRKLRRSLFRRLRVKKKWRRKKDVALGMVGDEWHGPNPPGEGWVPTTPGPRGGKRWRRDGRSRLKVRKSGDDSHVEGTTKWKGNIRTLERQGVTVRFPRGLDKTVAASLGVLSVPIPPKLRSAVKTVIFTDQPSEDGRAITIGNTGKMTVHGGNPLTLPQLVRASAAILLRSGVGEEYRAAAQEEGPVTERGKDNSAVDFTDACLWYVGYEPTGAKGGGLIDKILRVFRPTDEMKNKLEEERTRARKEFKRRFPKKYAAVDEILGGSPQVAMGMVGDEWHGPEPPGEGWVPIAPGPRGGKRWRRDGRSRLQVHTQTGARKVTGHKDVEHIIKDLFDQTWTPEDFARIAGGLEGAKIKVNVGDDGESVTIESDHPQYWSMRRVGVDEEGKWFVENNGFILKPGVQNQGIGTDIFASQVKEAQKMGFDYIVTTASRGIDGEGNELIGYYVWPARGYNAPIDNLSASMRRKIRNRFPGVQTIRGLLRSAGGREWWKEHGETVPSAWFDLKEGSRSIAILDEALKRRAARG